jgi:hypothetical protein
VLHLHHLTPIHEAAARVAPDVPVVGHLHGTELLMLEHIADGAPASWEHAEAWWERMRGWAARCERLVVLSASQLERVERLLDVDPERFKACDVDRARFWRHELSEAPRGWLPGQEPGSLRYPAELAETLIALGAIHALNLDGGGSTSLVAGGRLRNTPRESHGVELGGGRAVSTAIAFTER